MTMDQEEHLTEQDKPKSSTRSSARHLRRKRLTDARKAEKQETCPVDSTGVSICQKYDVEKDGDESNSLTKSKARRLRKKIKVKLYEDCYSLFDPVARVPCMNEIINQATLEAAIGKSPESSEPLTRPKAHKAHEEDKDCSACTLCHDTCASVIGADILKYMKTPDHGLSSCNETETDVNHHEHDCNAKKIVEVQVRHVKHGKKRTEHECQFQTQDVPAEILSELLNSKNLLGSLKSITDGRNTYDLVSVQVDDDSANDTKQKTECKDLKTNSVQLEKDSPDLKKSTKHANLPKVDQNAQVSNATAGNKKGNLASKSSSVKSTKVDKTWDKLETLSSNRAKENSRENVKQFGSTNPDCRTVSVESKPASVVAAQDHKNPSIFETKGTKKLNLIEEQLNTGNTQRATKSPAAITQPVTPTAMPDIKMNIPEKTREQIKAEREAKKAAKAAAKSKNKVDKTEEKQAANHATTVVSANAASLKPDAIDLTNNENVQDVANTSTNRGTSNAVPPTPSQVPSEGKSKAELRSERRTKQEAQRAAKQQQLSEKTKLKSKKEVEAVSAATNKVATPKKPVTPKKVVSPPKSGTPVKTVHPHEVKLFQHLYHERQLAFIDVPTVISNIHPSIVRLGAQYKSKVIVGSNARCVALLAAVKQLIQDFERPSQADFIRGLEASLQESTAYLHHCRPLAVSMQNALRHLKWQMTQLPSTLSEIDAKGKLGTAIDTYILEQIQLADKAISITIQTKISNGDVILTYGYSSLIHKILLDAHTAGKKFRVIVVDGRPWLQGKEQLRRLAKHEIECSYILINALSFAMPEVSKVFLGAHAILANGAVMSRVGTAQVALMARAFNVPVLVACETHKSCERVQTDSIVYNELGDADELAVNSVSNTKKPVLANWRAKKVLNLLNITYDVTPADLVTGVVTELAILPCTSVPVILRIKPSEI